PLVTGVQTCALPILASSTPLGLRSTSVHPVNRFSLFHVLSPCRNNTIVFTSRTPSRLLAARDFFVNPRPDLAAVRLRKIIWTVRSEERRVGKEVVGV